MTALSGSKAKDSRAWFSSDRISYTDNYNYEDGSDLGEEEDSDIFDDKPVITGSGDDAEPVTVQSADTKGNNSP